MSGIMTRPEAEKQAESIIKALEEMPADVEERESYLESLKKLNEEFDLGLAGEIQELEVGTEESETEIPSTETEKLDLSNVPNEDEIEDENGDDGNMQKNNEKGGFAAQVKGFMNKHLFGGVTVGHLVALVIGALIILVASWAVTSSTDELEQQIADLTTENTRLQTGWNEANTTAPAGDCQYNASTQEAAVEAAIAEIQSDLDDCQNETGGSVEVGTFDDQEMKDWISGSLKLQKTTIGTFELFESTDEAIEFITEVYAWNDAHNLKWNLDELSYAIADEHKNDDPAKAMFFSSKAVYIVLPSEDNIVIPEFYELDENNGEFVFNKVSPSSVSVVAMDKLKESKNND